MNKPLTPAELKVLAETERRAAMIARNKELAKQQLLAVQLALSRRPIPGK